MHTKFLETLTPYGKKQRQPLLKRAKRLLAMYNTTGKNGCPMKSGQE